MSRRIGLLLVLAAVVGTPSVAMGSSGPTGIVNGGTTGPVVTGTSGPGGPGCHICGNGGPGGATGERGPTTAPGGATGFCAHGTPIQITGATGFGCTEGLSGHGAASGPGGGSADPGGGSSGVLPFTGFGLMVLAALAAGLIASGLEAKRRAGA